MSKTIYVVMDFTDSPWRAFFSIDKARDFVRFISEQAGWPEEDFNIVEIALSE